MKPACFPTQKLFNEWSRCAILAREACTPCTDCSRKFAADMQEQHKCDATHVKTTFRILGTPLLPVDNQPFSLPGEPE